MELRVRMGGPYHWGPLTSGPRSFASAHGRGRPLADLTVADAAPPGTVLGHNDYRPEAVVRPAVTADEAARTSA